MSLQEEIISKEKSLLNTSVRRSRTKLRELISGDFREIGASGACFGLAELLEQLPQDADWSAQTQDREFRILGDGVTQTVHRAFIKKAGSDTGTFSYRTSIWRLENGSWKMVYHQGTKVAPFELQP
ncbi:MULTISPECIES: DUF4440 domain-containing protein [Microbulbifer]|uniref:nuclear transport factor 2 family protein n=1 Tax=Microbulbifer TaxID=48073 RepID=UPI001E467DDC|nr:MULTISPECIES: DUF4440 domain-containing protein [Microbulbifer]UHQ55029.1 nuclear transport factor 2 family protein [Microbulbifer sp. YPW16]